MWYNELTNFLRRPVMIIVMKPESTNENIEKVSKVIKSMGLGVHISQGSERTIIGVLGDRRILDDVPLELMQGVEKLVPIVEKYKLSGKHFKPDKTVIEIGDIKIGSNKIVLIAGPCAVESEKQILETAKSIKESGASILRGGSYKPRTSPYAFQGLKIEGLKLLKKASELTGLKTVTEVINEKTVHEAFDYVDIFQVGARNAQNFALLREIGKSKKPVIYKRGPSLNIDEWLSASEYIMNEGNYNIILCERGIKTFENSTRNTLDISAVPVIKQKSHLPIIIDPSHACGNSKYIASLSMAGIASGADGLMVEVHPDPIHALSDASQQIKLAEFKELCKDIIKITKIIGRGI
jgi:3-deoxy-7-phosphoheptulonate synthase